jgi:hypothetical protein
MRPLISMNTVTVAPETTERLLTYEGEPGIYSVAVFPFRSSDIFVGRTNMGDEVSLMGTAHVLFAFGSGGNTTPTFGVDLRQGFVIAVPASALRVDIRNNNLRAFNPVSPSSPGSLPVSLYGPADTNGVHVNVGASLARGGGALPQGELTFTRRAYSRRTTEDDPGTPNVWIPPWFAVPLFAREFTVMLTPHVADAPIDVEVLQYVHEPGSALNDYSLGHVAERRFMADANRLDRVPLLPNTVAVGVVRRDAGAFQFEPTGMDVACMFHLSL